MADEKREPTPSVKPKRTNAYDEPFGNQMTYDHVTTRDTEVPPPPADADAPTEVKKAPPAEEPVAPPPPPKKASPKKATTPKKKPAPKADPRKNADTRHRSSKTVHVTNKKDKPGRDPSIPRSASLFHRVMPYALIGLAIFIGLALVLNLFCNWDNRLEDLSQHWMGPLGYVICYGFFGMFGPAAFAIPLILVNLGCYWKRYVDRKLVISKLVASAVFLVMLASVIHIFCLIGVDAAERNISVKLLIENGAMVRGGGLVGGEVGYLLYTIGSFVGSLIIGFFLLLVSLFYFFGMAPHHLWNYLRNRRKLRARHNPSYSEQSAADAESRAKMDEKIRRTTGGQIIEENERYENLPPVGAVRYRTTAQRKTPDDKMAPMPQPRLSPNDGEDVYIPDAINEQMAAMEAEEAMAAEISARRAARAAAQARAARAERVERAERARSEVTVTRTAPAAPAEPPKPIDPASNRDAAVEPIFPKTAENRQIRRIPRSDRNFDLKNIFFEDTESDARTKRQHAPVPPEIPLVGDPSKKQASPKPTASPADAKTARPAAQARPVGEQPAAAASRPVSVTDTLRTPAASTAAPARPTAAQKPGANADSKPLPSKPSAPKPEFEQVTPQNQDFGLSNEEFEKLEAGQIDLTRPGAKKAPAVQKPASTAQPKTGDGAPKGDAGAAKKPDKPVKKPASKRYTFPPISYLRPGEPFTEENRAELEANMSALSEMLKSFHVKIEDNIRYSCGPTVTRYEITPSAGVRVRSITNLADDIALALCASGEIRIEAPIPGTKSVGIEVPNKVRSNIYLRELIESKPFTDSKSPLTACLGAGIAGEPLIFDIAKMPHLLIAGTTGSGKSVCINCIIMSLLYRVTPDEVRFVMIDPKKVEFSIYKNIPHLMAPVVTTPEDAAGALQAAVTEMERRFAIFEDVGVRDLKGYKAATADDPDVEELPYIVIIIDELADLMMTAREEVEKSICRIAQKARAAGMHLIIGTQRPSADVVTGLIKSNVPSRIAFTVKSQIDSRVILDHVGAEALTGRGDMLFVPIGSMRDMRVQGAFVDDKEVERICEFIRATNGTAVYDEKFIMNLKELASKCNKGRGNDVLPSEEGGEKVADPKYADAVRIAIEEKRISTSLLQRKLEIGYSRAAKLLDRMQSEGLISKPDGAKPRTVLITPEEYMAKFVDTPDDGAAD